MSGQNNRRQSDRSLAVGVELNGFVVRAITPVPALRAVAHQLEHQRTGARLLHLQAADTENLFSVSFPTPPPDDTGVPHILEHAVLSGSRKFPVRDPFFEMVKMSMATFINAMTGWDATYYPVASNVKRDLFNLAEVYFDAVFHPLLTAQTFQREGHHLAPANKDQPTGDLAISGIVYNEMKGAFSDPESRLFRLGRRLFPDTVYARESGGDPVSIPDLTHDRLKRFHATFYHPSNAYFYLYGDIPTAEFTAFLQDKLAEFDRRPIQLPTRRQPRWSAPRSITETYPAGPDEPIAEKTYLLLHWLGGDATDPADVALLRVLSLVLLGNEAAPLRKALIDSKLGQALLDSGDMTIGLENTFRIGLKGSEADRMGAFEKLVVATLAAVAAHPLPGDSLAAAFQQAAYHYQEVLPMFPLQTMERVLDCWMYGGDPLAFLQMSDHLAAVRRRSQADPQLFNRLIRERLLDNPHRLTVVLRPDREMTARTDAVLAARLQRIRAPLTEPELRRIAANAAELERTAGTPNTAAQLASLPQLRVRDLPPKPRQIPTTVEILAGGVTLLRNDVFANGVNYLHLDVNLDGLPPALWPLLSRYTDAVHKLGAAGQNYEQIAHRIAASTGGIGCRPSLTTHAAAASRPVWSLRFSLKTLDEEIEPALAVLRDLLFAVDPRDRARLRDVVTQALTAYRTHFVYEGASTAAKHAARGLAPVHHVQHLVTGLPQLEQVEELYRRFDDRHDELMGQIEAIRDFLLVRGPFTASFTGSDKAGETVRTTLNDWTRSLRDEPLRAAPLEFVPAPPSGREGLAAPIDVAYCAQVVPAPHFSAADAPLLVLGTRLVSADYVLSEIRFKGNAYGAWLRYDGFGSVLDFGSYRDPHVTRTLQVFAGATAYVRQADWSQTDIDRAIIGSAKEDERPIRPGEATGLALQRHLVGLTPERRERRYQRLLSGTPAAVKQALLAVLEANLAHSPICVVASRQKLEQANQQLPDHPLAIAEILRQT